MDYDSDLDTHTDKKNFQAELQRALTGHSPTGIRVCCAEFADGVSEIKPGERGGIRATADALAAVIASEGDAREGFPVWRALEKLAQNYPQAHTPEVQTLIAVHESSASASVVSLVGRMAAAMAAGREKGMAALQATAAASLAVN